MIHTAERKPTTVVRICFVVYVTLLIFSFIPAIALAQAAKIEKVESSTDDSGIFYALPITFITLEVEVKKVVTTPPPNPQLCNQLFGDCKKVFGRKPYENKTSFEVINVKTGTKSYPDKNNIYKVNSIKRWNQDRSLSFSISETGLIQGGETSKVDKTFEIVSTTVGSVIDLFFRMDAAYDSLVRNRIDVARVSPLKKRIDDLRNAKEQLIISSQGNLSMEAVKFKIDEIDKLIEKEAIELLGSRESETSVFKFEVEADTVKTARNILKISPTGVFLMSPNDRELNASPFKLSTDPGAGDVLTLTGERDPLSLGTMITPQPTKNGSKGLAYRIPGQGIFKIQLGNEVKAISTVSVAQFGSIVYLPYKINKSSIKYYESLGFLKEVSLESTSVISGDNISTAAGLATKYKDSRKDETELEKLESENKLLEAKKKNAELKKALEGN
jgi:hypothetical protein